MFELLEANLDIIGMQGIVLIGEGYLQILTVYQKVGHDLPKCVIKLSTMFCGDHGFDGNEIHGGVFGCIEMSTSFFPTFTSLCCGMKIMCGMNFSRAKLVAV